MAPTASVNTFTGSKYGFGYKAANQNDYDNVKITYDKKDNIYTISGNNVQVDMPSGDFNVFILGKDVTVKDLGKDDKKSDLVYLSGEHNKFVSTGNGDKIYQDGVENLAEITGTNTTVDIQKNANFPFIDASKASNTVIYDKQRQSGSQGIFITSKDSKEVKSVKENIIKGLQSEYLSWGKNLNSITRQETLESQMILDTNKQEQKTGKELTFGAIKQQYGLGKGILAKVNNIYLKDSYEINANKTTDLDQCNPRLFDRDYTKLVIPVDRSKYFTTRP